MKNEFENLRIMETFTKDNLPSLSTTVLGGLELFIRDGLPVLQIKDLKKPIIVGSGNAKVTAGILFADHDAIFADENNYQEAAERENDGAVIFSASGEKHATIVARYYTSRGIPTYLVTCNPDSSAGKIVGKENTIVTRKNREPYTYNTSTYMGWIFALTKEDPKRIYDFINTKVKSAVPKNIGDYSGYLLVTPEGFSRGNQLFETKFIELFARRTARDVKTFEELKHAITVVPYEKEACIQFGEGEVDFDEKRKIRIPLPKDAGVAAIMAIGYYVIGRIQEAKPPYFKENIEAYIRRAASTPFGKGLKVIVE